MVVQARRPTELAKMTAAVWIDIDSEMPIKNEQSCQSSLTQAKQNRPRLSARPVSPCMLPGLLGDEQRCAAAVHQQQRILFSFVHRLLKLSDVVLRLMIQFLNHIAFAKARIRLRTGRVDVSHYDTFGRSRESELFCSLCIQVFHTY